MARLLPSFRGSAGAYPFRYCVMLVRYGDDAEAMARQLTRRGRKTDGDAMLPPAVRISHNIETPPPAILSS